MSENNKLDIDFYDTYIIPEHELIRIRCSACAEYLEKNSPKGLNRLCQIGGFLIRNISPDWDQRQYKEQLNIDRMFYPEQCRQVHKYVMKHVTEHVRTTYFNTTYNRTK